MLTDAEAASIVNIADDYAFVVNDHDIRSFLQSETNRVNEGLMPRDHLTDRDMAMMYAVWRALKPQPVADEPQPPPTEETPKSTRSTRSSGSSSS